MSTRAAWRYWKRVMPASLASFLGRFQSNSRNGPFSSYNHRAHPLDLIFLVTDGFDQISNFDDVTSAIHAGDPDAKVRINCIFLESDPDPKFEECLKKIAHDSKGTFAKIEKSDM